MILTKTRLLLPVNRDDSFTIFFTPISVLRLRAYGSNPVEKRHFFLTIFRVQTHLATKRHMHIHVVFTCAQLCAQNFRWVYYHLSVISDKTRWPRKVEMFMYGAAPLHPNYDWGKVLILVFFSNFTPITMIQIESCSTSIKVFVFELVIFVRFGARQISKCISYQIRRWGFIWRYL